MHVLLRRPTICPFTGADFCLHFYWTIISTPYHEHLYKFDQFGCIYISWWLQSLGYVIPLRFFSSAVTILGLQLVSWEETWKLQKNRQFSYSGRLFLASVVFVCSRFVQAAKRKISYFHRSFYIYSLEFWSKEELSLLHLLIPSFFWGSWNGISKWKNARQLSIFVLSS